jgi:predicted transcriptional regulator
MTTGDMAKHNEPAPEGARARDALFCVSLFVHRHLHAIYGSLNLDLVSILLLDEIARHNLQPFMTRGRPSLPRDVAERKQMRGCNAFSLSQATGIPRETVRRKIKQLEDLGWIEKVNRKGYFVTLRSMDRISPGETEAVLEDFRNTARQVEEILQV